MTHGRRLRGRAIVAVPISDARVNFIPIYAKRLVELFHLGESADLQGLAVGKNCGYRFPVADLRAIVSFGYLTIEPVDPIVVGSVLNSTIDGAAL